MCVLYFIYVSILIYNILPSCISEIYLYSDASLCVGNEYFNTVTLKCQLCSAKKNLKPTADRLSCVCDGESKIVISNDLEFPTCERCPPNTFPSGDQSKCLKCNNVVNSGDRSECKKCSKNMIFVERELNGNFRNASYCEKCATNTVPDISFQFCTPCPVNTVVTDNHTCSCPSKMRAMGDGVCVKSDSIPEWSSEKSSYSIEYESGKKIISRFFQQYLYSSFEQCKMKNSTACQTLANMCTMILFYEKYLGSPCKIFLDPKYISSDSGVLPWLFYGEGDALTVLHRRKILSKYSLSSTSQMNKLNLTISRFSPTGKFKGLSVARGSILQLCPGPWHVLDSGLRFGSLYHHFCNIPAQQLLTHETEFFDLFLQYEESGISMLHAVPILTKNMKPVSISHHNEGEDPSQWLLTRRFFLVDKVAGIEATTERKGSDIMPTVVRYLKSCELRVRLFGSSNEGRIYPPLFVVRYGEVTKDEIESNSLVSIAFSIIYDMPSDMVHALEVSVGVFSSLAVVWSGIETWSNSRRSGRVGIDLLTLGELILFTCGNLANGFFLVMACFSLHTFFFYKGETVVHVLLPSPENEDIVKRYVIVSFVLKLIQVSWMIWKQFSIDIFFIDWERPKTTNYPNTNLPTTEISGDIGSTVSIWRSYFVANEWNEIQTKRKIYIFVQLVVSIFILKVIGVENWGVAYPSLSVKVPEYMASSPPSFICRFSIAVLIYVLVYIVQRVYLALIHERYIKNGIQQFVDICSMANISVFILSLEKYGYYIHGRSTHGFADTDMQTILSQLEREEEDLCGHRGLVPGTDHQTFEIVVPLQLSSYYKKVMTPITSASINHSAKRLSSAGGLRSKMTTSNVSRSIQAYHGMNKFLAAFLEHALVDLDYEVKEKLFSESLLDIEFSETMGRGSFYKDNGHSFDKILFYGNEFTLTSFDLMLFCFVEVIAQDFLLAGIVTAVLAQVLINVRSVGGRRNLARKTLIDERFLI